ncbi:MAG: pentapeptide repeat-containing protein [Xenococcus sp. (in: cyanobacteria)]
MTKIETFQNVSEFFQDVFDLGENNLIKAIAKAAPWAKEIAKIAPWAKDLVSAAGDTLPIVAFFLKYAQLLTEESEPGKQGYQACTLAYNNAVQEAFLAKAMELRELGIHRPRDRRLLSNDIPDDMEEYMEGFKLDTALSHPFIQRSDEVFRLFAKVIGLDAQMTNQLLKIIHQRFLKNLRLLLAHPDTSGQFEAFTALMELDDTSYQTQKLLNSHLLYQSWLFQEAPVFRQEPFALAHIYLDTQCGVLEWRQIKGVDKQLSSRQKYLGSLAEEAEKKLLNPFSEANSPRVDLLEKVKEYIGNPDFNEPIIIQGIAGAGKSSFTLRLVSELLDEGLTPIRVLLRDLNLNENIEEAIPNALQFGEKAFNLYRWKPEFNSNWLSNLLDINENITFGEKNHRISPYIFIFDGWDEISTAATTGFKDSIDRVLGDIRTTFIDQRRDRPQIRVIVTGRPSVDVTKTRLLKNKTPVLTIRPLVPEQLDSYITKFQQARETKPLILPDIAAEQLAPAAEQTIKFEFNDVKQLYRKEFEQLQEAHKEGNVSDIKGSMAVLGLPLLTYLSLRLMFNLDSEEQLKELIANPTTLYRALVDITCKGSGNPDSALALDLHNEDRYRIHGSELRNLLWSTAEAITAIGQEAISREELKLRLFRQDEEDEDFDQRVSEATENNTLSNLIISYYFKESAAGQGCEFLHKSFREYLFAEGVIERLKQYARDPQVAKAYQENPQQGYPERIVYWQDFKLESPQYKLTHCLAELLGTRWLTPEVKNHIKYLLTWEIARSHKQTGLLEFPFSNPSISTEQWTYIRDALADVWDWWGEGVLLRSQPKRSGRSKNPDFDPPYVVELAELSCPLDREAWKVSFPDVVRVNTVDARLGEAFFYLTALIHSELYNYAYKKLPQSVEIEQIESVQQRRYQTLQKVDGIFLVRFAPSGENADYFRNFCSRINSFGWRSEGSFPSKVCASLTNFFNVNLSEADLNRADLRGANLIGANLIGANLNEANLRGANLRGANLFKAKLNEANLRGANLRGAVLIEADLIKAKLIGANLRGANLSEADLKRANLRGADLSEAELFKTNLRGADLNRANLRGAVLIEVNMKNTIFCKTIMPDNTTNNSGCR